MLNMLLVCPLEQVNKKNDVLDNWVSRSVFPVEYLAKNPPANAEGSGERYGFSHWVRRLPRGGNKAPPEFLLGKSHKQRSPVGLFQGFHKELDTTEQGDK